MTGFIRAALFAGISDVQEHRRGESVQRANPLLGALWFAFPTGRIWPNDHPLRCGVASAYEV